MNASKTRGRLKLAFKSVAKAVGRHYADRVAEAAAALPAVIPEAQEIHSQGTLRPEVAEKLRRGPEQTRTVGPIVELLLERGWTLEQIQFGRREWHVPKRP